MEFVASVSLLFALALAIGTRQQLSKLKNNKEK